MEVMSAKLCVLFIRSDLNNANWFPSPNPTLISLKRKYRQTGIVHVHQQQMSFFSSGFLNHLSVVKGMEKIRGF